MATRADVARLAGVSTAVVSYVVNDGPKRVSADTAARVRKAIADLQYQPNAIARALTTGSARLLGFIVPDLTNPFFAELGDAIALAASARGYDLVVASSQGSPERERSMTLSMVARRVDGMVVATVLDEVSLATMPVGDIPRVLVDDTASVPGVVSVSTNLEDGAYRAVDHLVGHGYTDIGIATGTPAPGRVDERRAGWERRLAEAGLPPGAVILADFTREGGYQATRAHLRSHPTPRALFVASDLMAVGALRAVHEAGLQTPRDVALIAFDGTGESDFSWPRLSSVRQPISALAEAAVARAVNGAGPDLDSVHFTAELVLRDSCGCLAPPGPPTS